MTSRRLPAPPCRLPAGPGDSIESRSQPPARGARFAVYARDAPRLALDHATSPPHPRKGVIAALQIVASCAAVDSSCQKELPLSAIPRTPTAPPATSPNDPRYFDPRDIETELRRTFQICHECRMCVGYCGSFPELFARIDRAIDSGAAVGAEKLDDTDIKAVADQCWQCKLCFIKCPYTADDQAPDSLIFRA